MPPTGRHDLLLAQQLLVVAAMRLPGRLHPFGQHRRGGDILAQRLLGNGQAIDGVQGYAHQRGNGYPPADQDGPDGIDDLIVADVRVVHDGGDEQ